VKRRDSSKEHAAKRQSRRGQPVGEPLFFVASAQAAFPAARTFLRS
jgi:hypothetical protein